MRPIAKVIELKAEQVVPLTTPAGHRLVRATVASSGELLRLFVKERDAGMIFGSEVTGFASFPKPISERPYDALMTWTASDWESEQPLTGLTAAHPHFQDLPNDRILVVGARCRRLQDGSHDMNATIYEPSGTAERKFCLGDGIEHVQTDRYGRIWVGYFDEGVFGNYGWGAGSGPPPVGAAGLVQFDDQGNNVWEFGPTSGIDSITDCYALNVADDGVWACYYTGFPIVFVNWEGQVTAWQSELSGPRAVAVRKNHALVYGGYAEKVSSCRLVELDGNRVKELAPVKLCIPGNVGANQLVTGRGDTLHLVRGDQWYRFRVPAD